METYISALEYMKLHWASMKQETLEEIRAQCFACLNAYQKDLTQEEIDNLLDTLSISNKLLWKK